MTRESIAIEQPGDARPLILDTSDSIGAFQAVGKRAKIKEAAVPEHIVAAAVLQYETPFSFYLENQEIAKIALGWSRVQDVLDREGSSPILYIGDRGQVAGIADGDAQLSFEGADHNGGAAYLTVPAEAQFAAHETEVVENKPLKVYRPHFVLTSGRAPDAKRFVDHIPPHTYQMPNPGYLVVGDKAIDAYIKARTTFETSDECLNDLYDTFGFWDSEVMLSLAALKKVGVNPNLAKTTAKTIHTAGVKMLARTLAASLGIEGEEHGDLATNQRVLSRLPAIDFDASDIEKVTAELAGLVKKSEEEGETSPIIDFFKLNDGDLEAYLHEISASFMTHGLDIEGPAVAV